MKSHCLYRATLLCKWLLEVRILRTGDHDIDWENDPIFFIQVFRGLPECGHWALLVVERIAGMMCSLTQPLPNMCRDTMNEYFTECTTGTLLVLKGCKTFRATVLKQGIGAMDYGVFMCCVAGPYKKEILSHGVSHLRNSKLPTSRMSILLSNVMQLLLEGPRPWVL